MTEKTDRPLQALRRRDGPFFIKCLKPVRTEAYAILSNAKASAQPTGAK